MDLFYQSVEILASLAENLIILGFISRVSGPKYLGKKQSGLIFILGIALTCIVTFLNAVRVFSFLTVFIGIFLFISLTKLTSSGGLLLRSTACALAFFFLHTLDSLVGFSTALLVGDSTNIYESFTMAMSPGPIRVYYTLINKTIQLILFFTLHSLYQKIHSLSKKYLAILLVILIAAYITMSVLVSMIATDSLIVMQVAVIVSWLFIMICLIAVIAAIAINTQYQAQRRQNELFAVTNSLIEENYRKLNDSQSKLSQYIHDFTNHLRTINMLLPDTAAAEEYIQSLLESSQNRSNLCNCGNKVIDAIINCKASEAIASSINFTYRINLSDAPLSISSVDICAVLANQIDNAFEACLRIPKEERRFVIVEIWRKESFVLLKVVNSTQCDPFDTHHNLTSSKNDDSGLHGLGIKNICDTVSKYEGTLEMDYRDGKFISIAMLQSYE